MKTLISLCLSTIILSACSSNAQKEPVPKMSALLQQLTEQNGRACVRNSDIDGYGTAKNRVVTIDGGRKYYLATTLHACHELDTSARALFKGDFGEVCGNSLSKIVAGKSYCSIGSMYVFDSRKEAFATLRKARELRQEVIDRNKEQKNK